MYKHASGTKEAVSKMIELTGLGPEQNKLIGELSKGFRQRVGLAQALIHDPDILILDEPTSGLDPNQLVDIRNIISELGKSKTIILSTHIMQEVEAVCDRVVIIDKGKIVADDTAKNLSKLSGSALRFRVELKEEISENVLKKLSFINKVEKISEREWLLESKDNKDIREELFKFAVSKQLNVLSLSQSEQNMEDIFHKLTKQ
jgi:ABC-2 type transport system ATP-binding protein